jgi:hypothetical protein
MSQLHKCTNNSADAAKKHKAAKKLRPAHEKKKTSKGPFAKTPSLSDSPVQTGPLDLRYQYDSYWSDVEQVTK